MWTDWASRRRLLRGRRNAAWSRIRLLEVRHRECDDEDRRAELERRMACERRRLDNLRDQLARVPGHTPHKDIADVLGVPKGTVDSGIHYLKKKLRSFPLSA